MAVFPRGVRRTENRREVLGIGEQANDIKVVLSDEVVPDAGSFDWTGAEAGDVAHLANARRADARHAFDGAKRSQCGVEEPLGQLVAANRAVVRCLVDQVSLGQWAKPCLGRDGVPKARSRN